MSSLCRLAQILVFIGTFSTTTIVQAQHDANEAKVERGDFAKAARPQDVDAGKSEFESSCAPCHGTDGKGHGPLSNQLKVMPADLTALAKKNDGRFPFTSAYEFIDGRKLVAAHGTREMPIWGQVYRQETMDRLLDPKALGRVDFSLDPDAVVRDRILSLLDYLNRIQEK